MDWVQLLIDALWFGLAAAVVFFFRGVWKNAKIREAVGDLVDAAEQMFGDGEGAAKFDYVFEKLGELFRISDAEKEMLIESTVADRNCVWCGDADCECEEAEGGEC